MVNQRISLKDVAIYLNGNQVGGAESAEITLTRENEVAYESANYLPVEIVDGKITIEGSLTRAFLDVDLLNQLFPNQPLAPYFTFMATVVSGKGPQRKVEIMGAKLKSANISDLGLDAGWAKNTLPFSALNWKLSS